ncbi:AbrB family transcriptional regulator, partial [Staphylococcus hominis]|uniref:AbrB family transcriptional regulator n=1 Tax=Staphylococcus hominis TaxID=1290 RepID=UPI0011A9AF42
VSVLVIRLSLLIGYFLKKIGRVNSESGMLSVIPGGLSEMLIMGEEDKKGNMLVVSLRESCRVIFVVGFVGV